MTFRPTPGQIASAAMRLHHNFGGRLDEQTKQAIIRDVERVLEEFNGTGFYTPDQEEHYAAMLPRGYKDASS